MSKGALSGGSVRRQDFEREDFHEYLRNSQGGGKQLIGEINDIKKNSF